MAQENIQQPAAPATTTTSAPTQAPLQQSAAPSPIPTPAPVPASAPVSTPASAPISVPVPASAPVPTQSPSSAPANSPTSAIQTPATPTSCKCPTINPADWDKKKTTINKTFFKAFSPRLFYYPFSFVIDVLRATKGAQAKNYQLVENGMILDDCSMFWGNVMVEVTGANINDPHILSLEGREVYTKVSRNDWKNIRRDIKELEKELGKKPEQLLIWWTSCPVCTANREAKAVLIALP